MAFNIHSSSLKVDRQTATFPLNEETELAEAGQEAIPVTAPADNADFVVMNAANEDGFTYSATTEGSSLDLEPGFAANWPADERRYFKVKLTVDVAADEIGGPEEGAEDAIDVQLWDLEGEVLARSEEAEAAGGGLDVAEAAGEFTLMSPVLSCDGEDGFRVVVVNRPSGGEAADGEAADYEVVAENADIVITGI